MAKMNNFTMEFNYSDMTKSQVTFVAAAKETGEVLVNGVAFRVTDIKEESVSSFNSSLLNFGEMDSLVTVKLTQIIKK